MDPYIEILQRMRSEGAKFNPPGIQLGEMINSTILKIGDLQVDKTNLLIADYLIIDNLKADDVVVVIPTNDMQTYIILARVVRL